MIGVEEPHRIIIEANTLEGNSASKSMYRSVINMPIR